MMLPLGGRWRKAWNDQATTKAEKEFFASVDGEFAATKSANQEDQATRPVNPERSSETSSSCP